jgi:DNA-binding transcriptional MerR regulator/predicted RNase H-like HicB family nuclease
MPSEGAFSAEVARNIVGVTYRQLVYWDKTALIRPSVQRAKGRGSRRLYSFEDLVELRVVAKLLAAGVSLPAVRKAARYLRQHFADVARPLVRLSLQAEGKRVLVTTTDGKHLVDATAGGQVVITVAIAPIVKDVRHRVTELRHPRELIVKVRGVAYTALLTPDLEVGGFTIEVAELPGVITEADSLAEARVMVADAVSLWLDMPQRNRKSRAAR